MRARNIKPAFFKNEVLAELSADCRLLFIGLWCLADREGRLENRPIRIAGELFPYSSEVVRKNIGRSLEGLAKAGFLRLYEVGGHDCPLIEIVNFFRHQNPHKQETPSRLPSYSEVVRKNIGRESEVVRLIPPSPILNPDTPLLLVKAPEPLAPVGGFDLSWKKYPRPLGKKQAERHYKASVKTAKDFLDIQNALDNFMRLMRKEDRPMDKIPYGSTWFNNWRDYVNYNGNTVVATRPLPLPSPTLDPVMTDDDFKAGAEFFGKFK